MKQRVKPVVVMPYNPKWPQDFAEEAGILHALLQDKIVAIHHIGSTAVPGLAAKQDIDMLLIVKNLDDALCLQQYDYTFKGEINIPLRTFYSKNTAQRKINLHVCENHHGFIALNLSFRDWLRQHSQDRIAYQNLKQMLANSADAGIKVGSRLMNYSLQKNVFIKQILQKTGQTYSLVNFCMHEEEWVFAQQRRQQHQLPDLPNDAMLDETSNPNHHHFILYQSASIKAYAHVQRLNQHQALLHGVWTTQASTDIDCIQQCLTTLQPWLKRQGVTQLHQAHNDHGKIELT